MKRANLFATQLPATNYMAIFAIYIKVIAALLQVNLVLMLQTAANFRRHMNELTALLASIASASSQKGGRKIGKKRKPK